MDERICSMCGVYKPETEFYVKSGRPAASCKECHRAISRRCYDKKHRVPKEPGGHPCARCGEPVPEKKVGGKARKFCSRDCAVAQNRAEQPGRARLYVLAKYGIGVEDYEALVAAQNGRCAVCGDEDPASKSGVWHVDHCHATGAVRGLLCSRCNIGLGMFKDEPARLIAAAKYLEAAASA